MEKGKNVSVYIDVRDGPGTVVFPNQVNQSISKASKSPVSDIKKIDYIMKTSVTKGTKTFVM